RARARAELRAADRARARRRHARVQDRGAVHGRSVRGVLRVARRVRAARSVDQRRHRDLGSQVGHRRRGARRAVHRTVDPADEPERPVRGLAPAASPERPLHRRLVHARDVPLVATGAPMNDLEALNDAVDRACARIAPRGPLDRFIAVNPFWQRTDKPVWEVAGDLAALSGARLLMPREWYADEWRAGRLNADHLREAIAESGSDVTED